MQFIDNSYKTQKIHWRCIWIIFDKTPFTIYIKNVHSKYINYSYEKRSLKMHNNLYVKLLFKPLWVFIWDTFDQHILIIHIQNSFIIYITKLSFKIHWQFIWYNKFIWSQKNPLKNHMKTYIQKYINNLYEQLS